MKNIWTPLNVCSDCLMMAANNQTDPAWTTAQRDEFFTRFTKGHKGFDAISPGSDHADCNHDLYDEDCPEDDGHFSMWPCDLCRTPLGGNRYPAMALKVVTA